MARRARRGGIVAKADGVHAGDLRSSSPAFAFGLFTWLMHLAGFVQGQASVR